MAAGLLACALAACGMETVDPGTSTDTGGSGTGTSGTGGGGTGSGSGSYGGGSNSGGGGGNNQSTCTSNCPSAGTFLCSNGAAQQCYRTAEGCLQYGPPTACQGGLVCKDSIGCSACSTSLECDTTAVCGADRRCAAPWGKKFDFVIVSAVVAHKDASGALWDPNGIPDPRVILYVNDKEVGRTSFKQDTETPVWNERISVVLNQGDKLSIGLWDTDLSDDDYVDSVSYGSLLYLLRAGGDSGPMYQGSSNSITFTVVPHPI
jgi:hypothetical protein